MHEKSLQLSSISCSSLLMEGSSPSHPCTPRTDGAAVQPHHSRSFQQRAVARAVRWRRACVRAVSGERGGNSVAWWQVRVQRASARGGRSSCGAVVVRSAGRRCAWPRYGER
jgi:hypothetical protein